MNQTLGKYRLLAIRALFLITAVSLLPSTFTELFNSVDPLEPYYAIAMSFWLALSLLALVGVLHPVKMLPLLLLQFLYKLLWLLSVGLPLYLAGQAVESNELFMANAIGVVLDLLIIPWLFVAKQLVTFSTQRVHESP